MSKTNLILGVAFLVRPVFGYMEVKSGVILFRKCNGLLQQVVVHGKRSMQPHMPLMTFGQKSLGFRKTFLSGSFSIPIGDFVAQHV